MSSAQKHRERSKRSYRNSIPVEMFARNARLKKFKKERFNLFNKLFSK